MTDRSAPVCVVAVIMTSILALGGPAFAQSTAPEPIESMPIHAGPVGLRPSLSITNAGSDSNVFNETNHPQEDLTATIIPRLVARLRAGRVLFSYGAATDLVYFQDVKDEESVNFGSDFRLDANLGRLQPYVSSGWVSTRERLNAEIDERAPHTQRTITVGTRLSVASHTDVVFNGRHADLEYDQGSEFRGTDLAHNLNSKTDSFEGGVQLALTPLTTLNLTALFQRDRFDLAHERDADTFRITPALQFDPTALIRGTVSVGYRHFRPLDSSVPDYSGVVVQAIAGYTLLERTKLDLDLARDVQYSYEDLEPYYLATGGRLTATYQLVGPIDVQAFGGRQSLGYRSTQTGGESRTDHVEIFGGGAGYRWHSMVRLGLTWEMNRRLSELPDRRYERRRLFASFTYGS